MFCNSWCNNNSTNFNNNSCGCGNNRSGCGCNNGCGSNNSCGCNSCGNNNSCGCNGQRSNGGCGWYTCPCSGNNNFFWLPSTVTNPVPPTTPTVNLGSFTNPSALAVAADATIPLSLTRQVGSQITSSGTGALLPTGIYEVSYSVSGTPVAAPSPSPETVTVGLRLNGANVPNFTQSASTTATTDPYNISSQGVVDVTSPNSILTLTNLSATAQNFTDANLIVRKIS